jgi:acetyl-CoA acetyltransferase family protein
MADAYFIDGVRTVFGKAGGALAGVRADDLAASAIAELLARNPQLPPDKVDDVVWGATNQAGDDSRNVGRTAALLAGMPEGTAGYTVNRLCGSGLEAAATASRAIRSGDVDLCIAGGSESMSRAPFILPRPDRAYPRTQELYDSRLGWRGVNPRWAQRYGALTLGECAELTAERYGVSRARQDEYAARSHELAARAWDGGSFDADTIPGRDPDGLALLTRDESIRPAADPESLARLRPAFRPGGTVTAGNSSPLNDGASMLLLGSEAAAQTIGTAPLARVVSRGVHGVDPDVFGIAPVEAANKALAKAGITWDDVDVVELNEAFASQSLACLKGWPDLDPAMVNMSGGAIAIGHPLGASGARVVGRAVEELRARGGRYGVATLCIGVGQGLAMVLERVGD